jgi:hypothetical protein
MAISRVSPAQIKVGTYNFTFALVRMSPRRPCRTWVIASPRIIERRTER